MYREHAIQRIAAATMLLLFALSITPKQLLHDTITGHKHKFAKPGEHVSFQAAKNNFQCNWDEQVVESPFIGQPDFQLLKPPVIFSSHINHYTLRGYSSELFFFSLRGPPSLA